VLGVSWGRSVRLRGIPEVGAFGRVRSGGVESGVRATTRLRDLQGYS
jgi:hypothetical protein